MPRYRSFYAVEVALLNHITDCLHFCRGSMKAAVLVWANPREVWEQELLLGPDRTLLGIVGEPVRWDYPDTLQAGI